MNDNGPKEFKAQIILNAEEKLKVCKRHYDTARYNHDKTTNELMSSEKAFKDAEAYLEWAKNLPET